MIGEMLRGSVAMMAIFSVNGPAPGHDRADERRSDKALQPVEFPWCIPARRVGLRTCPRA